MPTFHPLLGIILVGSGQVTSFGSRPIINNLV